MDDNSETVALSKIELDEHLDEVSQTLQRLRDYYKRNMPEEMYKYFDDKTFYVQMLWRHCPEKLLYPAVEQWKKALEKDINPLDIFLLGWHTGSTLKDLEVKVEASIQGRMHRTGTRTKKRNEADADSKFRKVYDKYNSPNNKETLNKLLQLEFGADIIKEINKPNPKLNCFRARYYRAKKSFEREHFQEDTPDDDKAFFTAYLDYIIRHRAIWDYMRETDQIICLTIKRGCGRTNFERFIHENAELVLWTKSIAEWLERKKKGKQGSTKPSKKQRDDENK